MQDPAAAFGAAKGPAFPEPEQQVKCPRCDSLNTKFCYYNNYNLSQPRHFCKNCRRYWTKGGALRNIPVGGGTRKSSAAAAAKRSGAAKRPAPSPPHDAEPDPPRAEPERAFGAAAQSFSSLLASSGQFGGLFEGAVAREAGSDAGRVEAGGGSDGYLGLQSGDWGSGASGWPNLAIYTPGSSFQ